MTKCRFSVADEEYMRRALELAEKARGKTSPNPMVGAVLVKNGKIIGEGYHQRAGLSHAEVIAINTATEEPAGATLYVTLEPCAHYGRTPPCTDAMLRAKIKRVVIPCTDPNPLVSGRGVKLLRQAGVKVDCGLLETEARKLNEFFFTYHLKRRPFVILKWAMSLDGRTSTDTGESKWITNALSREYVHQLRSQVDVVIVGAQTVIQDDPLLTVRLKNYKGRQPRRVILDYALKVPATARCLTDRHGGERWVITHQSASRTKIKSLEKMGVRVICLTGRAGKIDVKKLMELFFREQIISVMVEGGRRLAGSFMRAGMVDKVVAFIAPRLIGGNKLTAPIVDWAVSSIKEMVELTDVQIKFFDNDIAVEGYLNRVN